MAVSMPESISRVRDPSIPDSDLNPSERFRRLILKGESFGTRDLEKKDYALLSMQKTVLGRLGFKFETKETPTVVTDKNGKQVSLTTKEFRCTNPGHQPTEADYAANRTAPQTRPKRVKKSEPAAVDPASPFDCPKCGSERKSKDSLRHHLREAHGLKLADVGLSHLPNAPRKDRAAPTGESVAVARHDAPTDLLSALNGTAIPMGAPVPMLGAATQIVGLVLQDDGSIDIAIKSGERKWLTSLKGTFGG